MRNWAHGAVRDRDWDAQRSPNDTMLTGQYRVLGRRWPAAHHRLALPLPRGLSAMVPGRAPECEYSSPRVPTPAAVLGKIIADEQYPKWQKSRRLRVIVPVSCTFNGPRPRLPSRRGERPAARLTVPRPKVGDRGFVYVLRPALQTPSRRCAMPRHPKLAS